MPKIFLLILLLIIYLINSIKRNITINKKTELNTELTKELNSKLNLDKPNLNKSSNSKSIKFVFTMFRHGARAPYYLNSITNIDFININWENYHSSELTNVGLRQHYLLGLNIRERYDGYLSAKFQPGDIYALSTDRNRTIQSFLAQFQGIYDQKGNELTEDQIKLAVPPCGMTQYMKSIVGDSKASIGNYTAIMPFHKFDINSKYFQLHKTKNCKGVVDYKKQKDPYIERNVKNFMQQYGKQLKEVLVDVKITDPEVDVYKTRMDLYNIADCYIANYYEKMHNFFPKEDEENAEKKDSELAEIFEEYLLRDIGKAMFSLNKNYIARISMSRIVPDILEYMKRRINIDQKRQSSSSSDKSDTSSSDASTSKPEYTMYSDPRILMYSAHDTDIAPMMSFLNYALNIKMNTVPYASSYIWELVLIEKEYKVRILFNNEEIYFDSFDTLNSKLIEAVIPDDELSNFCGFKNSSNRLGLIIAILLLSLILTIFVVYITIICVKQNKARKSSMARNNVEEILPSSKINNNDNTDKSKNDRLMNN